MQYFAIQLSSCLGEKKFCQALLLHIVTLLLPGAVPYLCRKFCHGILKPKIHKLFSAEICKYINSCKI